MIDNENMPDVAKALRDGVRFPRSFARSTVPFDIWHRQTTDLVREALGIVQQAAPAVRVLSETTFTGHLAQRLTLDFAHGETAQAFLLLPRGSGPFPAVLLLHDHGSDFEIGKEKLIAPWDDIPAGARHQEWTARLYGGRAPGDELVRRGYMVLCVDALGWGSRKGNGYEAQQALASNLMQLGTSLAAVVAGEDVQSALYLANHPATASGRIAAVGFSFGGYRAWQVAALSDTLRAVVASGWMAKLTGLMQPGNNLLRGQSAFYTLHPRLAGLLDFPDIACLIAPRPALFQAGRLDRHFPPDVVEEAFSDLAAVWFRAGAAGSLVTQFWDVPHIFGVEQQNVAFNWLDRMLAPRDLAE